MAYDGGVKLQQFERYGLKWAPGYDDVQLEMHMVKKGGRFKHKGQEVGGGMEFHFKKLIEAAWPEVVWHPWAELQLKCYLEYRIIGQMGPASCVDGNTPIYDPSTGESPTIKYLCDNGIQPIVQTLYGPMKSGVPFLKGKAMLYLVESADGRSFRSTADHLVLSESGFVPVGSLRCGQLLLSTSPIPVASTSGIYQPTLGADDPHCWNKVPGCRYGCPPCSCSCDELLPWLSGNAQGASPSPTCAQEYKSHCALVTDDPGHTTERNHSCRYFFPQTSDTIRRLLDNMGDVEQSLEKVEMLLRGACLSQSSSLSRTAISRCLPVEQFCSHACSTRPNEIGIHELSFHHNKAHLVPVSRITPLKVAPFYDLTVPVHHHYFANGFIHHNTGKSFVPSACVLADYYCFPHCTTVLVSSTTRESLEMRVWGEIKKLHKLARARFDYLPGYLIEGKQRIVTDPRTESSEGRDFRNGLAGVACKRGQSFQGMEEYVGIKNKRLRMLADELQFLPKQFVDSISNMNKNPDFKCVGSGNPKDTTDALGVLCEPAAHLGGWDGGIDQVPKTKTWEIRFPRGICIQLCGADSPNLDGKMSIPLITQEQIDNDIKFYGKDSIQFSMMDMGMMPRGQGSRRVITRQLCHKFGAMEDPLWMNSVRTRVGFLDAAYKGTGGDRCVFGELQFGVSSEGEQIMAMIDTMVIPIRDQISELPEDQIVTQVRDQCERRGIEPEHVFFDSTGRGSLMGAFGRLWSPRVVPVEFGGMASERPVSGGIDMSCRDYYANFVTELWYTVRQIIEAGQFRGMTEEVMSEGCQREWTIVGKNKIQVEPKDKMKLKTGRSPDLFDALAAGVEGARRLGFKIEGLSQKMSAADSKWRLDLRKQARKTWADSALSYRN
jgi:hypothetical protein